MYAAGADKALEVFKVRSAEQIKQQIAKRTRQRKKKAQQTGEEAEELEPLSLASVEV